MLYQKEIIDKLVPVNPSEYRRLKEATKELEASLYTILAPIKRKLWKMKPRWNDYKPIGNSQSEWSWATEEYR